MMEMLNTQTLKLKWFFSVAAGIALILLSYNAFPEDSEIAVVTEILEPYQFLNTEQGINGYGIDVLNALMARVGRSPQIEIAPWPRIYKKALNNKNTIILSMARTPEREKLFHWIGQINHETFSFYALKNNENIKSVTSLNEVKNYSVVVTKDSVLDEIARSYQLPRLERSADHAQGFKLLYRQRADLYLIPDSAIKQQASVEDYDYKDLVKIYQVEDPQFDFYIAINIDSDPELVARLKNEFKWLQDNHVIQDLKAKWNF